MFKDQVFMITGGTGSFGHCVLKRLLDYPVREVRVLSRDEKKQEEMRRDFADPRIRFMIGDVRDYESVSASITGVDYVFHAAALKQVPSCEFFPSEAIKTNINGIENVVRASIACGIKKMVALSTDKAVYPVNVMGMTKALMERVVIANSRYSKDEGTVLCCTRYGNVLWSRGSVLPLFVSQAKSGVPLTVTDPKMTRFIMSLEEAVDLVLFAFEHGQNGDILIQKSPATSIGILAEAVLELLNKSDIRIKTIGTRHGEKLYESLLSREEKARALDLGGYYSVPADFRDLNYGAYIDIGETVIDGSDDYNSHNARQLTLDEVVELLSKVESSWLD